MIWLQQTGTRRMLTTLLSSDKPVSHKSLDGLQHGRHGKRIGYLRSVLVTTGVLPPRDDYLAALEQWVPTALAAIADPGERAIVRSFATWRYLRRLRQASKRKMISYGQLAAARREIEAAIKLLDWLGVRDTNLAACTQTDIDLWLLEGPWQRNWTRPFLQWTSTQHRTRQLDAPVRATSTGVQVVDDDERWSQIQQLLHDTELDLTVRVAGLLLLLFAQPVSRITRLTTSDVTDTDGTVTLKLGSHDLELPPPLDSMVLELRDAPAPNHREADRPRLWLLGTGPRNRPGRPISSQHLNERLLDLGIQARRGRNTTLMELAAELPAAVLARLLGLHLTTATNWNHRSGSPRAAYAAELARRNQGRSHAQSTASTTDNGGFRTI
jgi:hypothetical protein